MVSVEFENRGRRPPETLPAGAKPCAEAAWYRALVLTERAAPGPDRDVAPAGTTRGRRWREVPGLADEASFLRRLAAEGLSARQFDRALAESPEALSDRCPRVPPWLTEVLDAYEPARASDVGDVAPKDDESGLLALVRPLVLRGRERLRAGAAQLARDSPDAPFDPDSVEPMLQAHLTRCLTEMVARTAVLEMHVARLEGRLEGDMLEERFRAFVQHLGEPAVGRRLLAEYPVLARLVVQAIDQWVAASLEFLGHLCTDTEALRGKFHGGGDLGILAAIESGAGDAHRRGRTVRILRFTSGLRLVYKPRAMAVDRHFGDLLAWLNERCGDLPQFRVLRVLDRADHGWVEFVEHLPCQTESEVERFYFRQGMNLALLYALGATDFHDQNLIASSEHPVLIDLESMLVAHEVRNASSFAGERAARDLQRSVLSVGLLPSRVWAGRDADGIDLSGLGSKANQLTPTSVPVWDAVGTDAMHLLRRQVPFAEANNHPTLAGRTTSVVDHTATFTEGFTATYRLLERHRDDLLAAGGPLAAFADDEVRVILRPTATYGALIMESYHPNVLRDALDRDRLFDYLWADVARRPELAQVFSRERADLWCDDFPSFTTRPGSRDLWDSRAERIDSFFTFSGMDMIRERLGQFGTGDLARQSWYIRASLGTLVVTDRHASGAGPGSTPAARVATPERLLAAAQSVGDRLKALAISGDDDVTWNGLVFGANRHPYIAPLGLDLYEGLPGVTLFLAQLGAVTGEGRYTTVAEAALMTQLHLLDRDGPTLPNPGAHGGMAGLVYEFGRLSVMWGRDDLRQRAEAVVETLPPLIDRDEQLDVIAGSAGCLGCLLAFYQRFPSKRTLEVMRLCGDRLLETAQAAGPGLAWPVPRMGGRPLAGFSHGAAGMAWALLGLSAVTSEDRYRKAAQHALAYERSLYCAEAGNWQDLRPRDPGENTGTAAFMTAWCHGAPGIGLARLSRLPQLDDATARAEIATAIRTTMVGECGGNHSLCHGDLGNLELLLQAHRTLRDPRLEEPLARATAAVLDDIETSGWRCGVPNGIETPGLMTGLAGIGYQLLRLAEPDRVPSVVMLEI